MDCDMSVDMATLAQVAGVEQIVQLINTFYFSKDPEQQSEANRRLTDLQSSDQAWHLWLPLLNFDSQYASTEVQFFASNMLVMKINQSWSQQDDEWLEKQLRPKIFETLVAYASRPSAEKLVVSRLALALATFALHSIPTFWPTAIEDILQTFNPHNLNVAIPAQTICDILLKILMYIPEEHSVLMPQKDHRAKLNCQMTKSGAIVFKFLHSLLIADNSSVSSECKQSVLKCITCWTLHSQTSLLELEDGKSLLHLIYDYILDDELCSSACMALGATFETRKAENYTNAVMDFTPKIAQLRQVLDKYLAQDEVECAIKIYSLIINFSENHSRLFLKIVLDDETVSLEIGKRDILKQAIFTIIKIILDCTSAPGIYGQDEKYSDISFTFWFNFLENFYYCTDSQNELACKTFNPLVDSLLHALVKKVRYPSTNLYYQGWNDDQREAYRCYRQDIGDNLSLIVHFPKAKDRIVAILHEGLEKELSYMLQGATVDGERSWQGFEAVIFALKSIAEIVVYDEDKHMPKIFALMSQVPFNDLHPLLYCTAAEMISSYSDWLFNHNTHLAIAFNILFLGINSMNSHVRLMSTLSLKDITSECQTNLHPFASQIVESCTSAILQHDTLLNTNEKSRLMYTIGTTLATMHGEAIVAALNTLTLPILTELNFRAQSDPNIDLSARPIILEKLSMLNSLVESLYVRELSGSDYDLEGDENDPRVLGPLRYDMSSISTETTQPSLTLLKELIPILRIIAAKYQSDEEIINLISDTIKRSTKSLGIDIRPLVQDLLSVVVNAYEPMVSSVILDGCQPIYTLFRNENEFQTMFLDSFARITEKTLAVCLNNPLGQLVTTIEHYFRYASLISKKFPSLLTMQPSKVDIELIYKLALASLELPEKKTLTEVCHFLGFFGTKTKTLPHIRAIFVDNIDQLLNNVFRIFGGNLSTPRNAIETVEDMLFLIIDNDRVKRSLDNIVEKDKFPTDYVKRDQKAQFVSRIVHERNRKKFKDACNEFVLIARNLSRAT